MASIGRMREMTRAMITSTPSPHFVDKSDKGNEDDTRCGGSPGRRRGTSVGDFKLNGSFFKASPVRPGTKNVDGFSPLHREFSLSAVTRFLAEVERRLSETSGQSLRHELSSAGNVTFQDLLSAAESNTSFLTSLVEDIVTFASMKSTGGVYLGDDCASFLVGVKDHHAIERKAGRKYGGNILLVKDILRAQITFAEEGTLVCGLLRLFLIAGHLEGDGGSDSRADVKLVRTKFIF